jgi:preprotein translocase subunit SecE
MSAQRRTAVKRDRSGTGSVQTPRRTTDSPKAAPVTPPERASKPQASRNKAAEAKPHPLTQRIEQIRRSYRETRAEIAKVTWPDKETTRNLTIVVIGISFVLGVLLGGIDYIFLKLLEAMS